MELTFWETPLLMHKYIKIFKISLPDVLCSEKQSGLIINCYSVCARVCMCDYLVYFSVNGLQCSFKY